MSEKRAVGTRPKRRRRWLQFRLRTLLLVMAGCAVVFAVWSAYLRYYRNQHRAIKALTLLGARVVTEPAGPEWLRQLTGMDFVRTVRVNLSYPSITDAEMEQLDGLPDLEELHVWNTRVTDEGLEQVRSLRHLKVLVLCKGQVTDEGLEHLRGLRSLRVLQLVDVPITGAGLEHLKELRQLETLHLRGTQVSDVGVAELKKALPGLRVR